MGESVFLYLFVARVSDFPSPPSTVRYRMQVWYCRVQHMPPGTVEEIVKESLVLEVLWRGGRTIWRTFRFSRVM